MALEIFRLIGSVFVDTDEANKSLKKTDENAQGFGKTLLDGITTAAKWAAGLTAAAGAAATAAVKSYAEYEQLEGGVVTLFEDSADQVIKNAESAYKTAGLSASDYMNTVTGFAASLLQSLGGDTEAAAKYADMAITDMSDNANKLGSSMESIQAAYSGFSKGQYQLLDNLKLGYGGTKTEMERLLADADAINAKQGVVTNYSLENLSDVYEAIHVVQGELGIAGATALEATTTIEGGIGLVKAKLSNLFTEIGGAFAPVAQSLITMVIDGLPMIEGLVDKAIPVITNGVGNVVAWLDTAGDKFQIFLAWLRDIGGYAVGTFQPIVDDLATAFGWVKQQLEPLITALEEYFTSGQAAEDITNAVKAAVDFLSDAYVSVKGFIGDVARGIQGANTWMQEHESLTALIAIAIGTLTAAIVAYNVAQAIKNAGGIVEIAQLAAIAIGIAGLTVAETAHTVATTVATAATTAFGAAMAFLTSPITGVVVAIGAAIAIIVLLVKNWDTVKEAAIKCWDWIKQTWEKVATWFNENVIQPIGNFFSGLWTSIKNTFGSVKTWFKDTFTSAWTAIKNVFSSWGSFFGNLWTQIKDKFSAIGTNIANAISSSVKSGINGVISSIERIINTGVSLINGAISIINTIPGVSIGKLSKLNLPRLARGGVVDEPTVAQIGEDGAEAVVPLERNTGWIDRLSEKVAQSIVVQTAQGNSNLSLDKVLDKMDELLDALRANQTVTLNKREFARIVKEVG